MFMIGVETGVRVQATNEEKNKNKRAGEVETVRWRGREGERPVETEGKHPTGRG
jgi:hypothetical protein